MGTCLPAGRQLALTVDVEAFDASRIELWCQAMADWGREAAAAGLRFSHFVSMEHVARLRTRHPGPYEEFACSLRSLLSAKCRIYPHNHCVFDPVTGEFPGESSGWPQRIVGYRPRASMFYDVVRRHNLNLAEWLGVVTAEYDRLLRYAELAMPSTRAFRPGGWDHGSTADEMRTYVSALATCGYRVDSSDAAGAFGDRTWRVGTAFGKNVYRLPGGMIELAPSWSLTCGAPLDLPSRPGRAGWFNAAAATVDEQAVRRERGRSAFRPSISRLGPSRRIVWRVLLGGGRRSNPSPDARAVNCSVGPRPRAGDVRRRSRPWWQNGARLFRSPAAPCDSLRVYATD